MVAYTDAQKIANYLGVTLTSAQQTQAGICAQAASDWIDAYKARSWQGSSPVSNEVQDVIGDTVWLTYAPVATVTSVETRAPTIGSTWTTLSAGQYEIADATTGQLRIAGWGNYEARVSYTHAAVPPANVALAATMIASSLLAPTLRPNTQGVDSISVGQNDITVKFAADYADVPAEALTLLGARGLVIA